MSDLPYRLRNRALRLERSGFPTTACDLREAAEELERLQRYERAMESPPCVNNVSNTIEPVRDGA